MRGEEIEEKVIAILRDQKALGSGEIDRDKPLSELGIDSLDALNILFIIEETFSISIPDGDARSISTLSDMIRVVELHLPEASSA